MDAMGATLSTRKLRESSRTAPAGMLRLLNPAQRTLPWRSSFTVSRLATITFLKPMEAFRRENLAIWNSLDSFRKFEIIINTLTLKFGPK